MTFGLPNPIISGLRDILSRHPSVSTAVVFGSRAMGKETPQSDVDIALTGEVDAMEAEGIALEFDELPTAVKFDLQVVREIRNPDLRDHIERVGKKLYERDTAPVRQ